jgi:hypothetical protein
MIYVWIPSRTINLSLKITFRIKKLHSGGKINQFKRLKKWNQTYTYSVHLLNWDMTILQFCSNFDREYRKLKYLLVKIVFCVIVITSQICINLMQVNFFFKS